MKVHVDYDLCEGKMKCEMNAPEVFKVGDDDQTHLLMDEIPEELKAKVDRAIRLCPRLALSWAQDS